MTTHRFESPRSHFWDSFLIIVLEITLFIKKACNWLLEIPLKKANKLIKLVKGWRDWYWKVPITGIVAFAILFWVLNCNLPLAIFLGAFAAFTTVGPYVFNTDDFNTAEKFCDKTQRVAEILIKLSLLGIAFDITGWFDGHQILQLFSWPLLIVSIVLYALSGLGQWSIAWARYEEDRDADAWYY